MGGIVRPQERRDLLFAARLAGRDARLYLLFEHQSRVHRLMPFRLLVYEVRVWEAYLREHPDAKRLPVIVPVVLHHSVKGWTAAVSFEALLDVDAEALSALGEHVVRFRFVLDDISRQNEHALRSRKMSPLGRLVLWCLKMARTPEKLRRGLRGWRNLLREVRSTPNGWLP